MKAAEEKTQTGLTAAEPRLAVMEEALTAVVKPFFKEYEATVEAVIAERGLGSPYVGQNGVGITVVPRKGRWVDFTPYEVKRTRVLDGPGDKHTLTLQDCKALGLTTRIPTVDVDFLGALLAEIASQAIAAGEPKAE
jgi:hypothetical protein